MIITKETQLDNMHKKHPFPILTKDQACLETSKSTPIQMQSNKGQHVDIKKETVSFLTTARLQALLCTREKKIELKQAVPSKSIHSVLSSAATLGLFCALAPSSVSTLSSASLFVADVDGVTDASEELPLAFSSSSASK